MDLEKSVKLFKQFNELLENKKTGKPNQFAKKLGISERTLYRIINSFNRQGLEIKFERKDETYYISPKNERDSIKLRFHSDVYKSSST
ncbi:MAG: helix-turn-helix domain-containing protein [Tenuifilaceae bacterium]